MKYYLSEFGKDLGLFLMLFIGLPISLVVAFAIGLAMAVGYTLRDIIDLIGDVCYIVSEGFDGLEDKVFNWAVNMVNMESDLLQTEEK